MTIRPVHVDGALTLAEWRALDPTGGDTGPTRPLCDGAIGSSTVARRSTDEAASRAFDEPDLPRGSRAVGRRGHLNPNGELEFGPHTATRGVQKARRAVQTVPTDPATPETENAT